MVTVEDPKMGRFAVEVDLANNEDLIRAKLGLISPEQVRRVRVRGVVDTGATRLVIPAAIAQRLGLESTTTATVRYADGRTTERPVAKGIQLSYGGRDSIFSAVVEPDRTSALVGAIVLEELDFVVDCSTQQLLPRDPKRIVSEIE